ncbi:MAG: SDR family oxidoreductase [Pirellulales bacterium]|nr:SDR family oxidoreductase [Pirellulales bacterium]
MRFNNKTVLVTGSSRNTGFGIADSFAKEGATVFIHGSTAEHVHNAANELRSRGYGRIIEAPADLSNSDSIQALFAHIRNTTERLDILVNNAVLQGCGYSFQDTPLELFEQTVRVNLIGLFHVAREAARMMLEQKQGTIINISSNVSTRAIHNRSAYCASKGGVDSLTQAMAVDLGTHGIRVNAVAPGYIYTERWEDLPEKTIRRRHTNIPLGKEASAKNVAAAVLFLASEEAANIHGARLVVDGGCSAQHMPHDVDE